MCYMWHPWTASGADVEVPPPGDVAAQLGPVVSRIYARPLNGLNSPNSLSKSCEFHAVALHTQAVLASFQTRSLLLTLVLVSYFFGDQGAHSNIAYTPNMTTVMKSASLARSCLDIDPLFDKCDQDAAPFIWMVPTYGIQELSFRRPAAEPPVFLHHWHLT
ncbi:hypothetical protein EDB89DRAFT_1903372 [Lactarius sanguifluus]|nr:hypothetical protein EDB89DRAFT_1903372 [Lactarius sanguifluus]